MTNRPWILLTILISAQVAARADVCDVLINPHKAKVILLQEAAISWPRALLKATPLEVAAHLRNWKIRVARHLDVNADQLVGSFQPRLSAPRQSEGWTFFLVESRLGLKTIMIENLNVKKGEIRYIDPGFPTHAFYSTLSSDGRVSAFVDNLDPSARSGLVVGTLHLELRAPAQ